MYGFTVITNAYDLVFAFALHSRALLKINEPLTDEYDNFTLLYDSPEVASAQEEEFDVWYNDLLEEIGGTLIDLDFDLFS